MKHRNQIIMEQRTTKEKNLLLSYLCGCIHYDLAIMHKECDTRIYRLRSVDFNGRVMIQFRRKYDTGYGYGFDQMDLDVDKPFVRHMNSMTEEEKSKFDGIIVMNGDKVSCVTATMQGFDYLNSLHLDYLGLADRGLAIVISETNNPYEIKEKEEVEDDI